MPSTISSQAASLSSQSFRDSQVKDERNEDDQILSNEVVTVLSELGHYNRITNTYQLNIRDNSSCLRDLIRYLRHDGSTFLIRRQMGLSNVVNNDLLPIVEQHTVTNDLQINETGKSIMDKVVRLLVDLTNPTILHYKDQRLPKDDKHEMQIYLELQSFLYSFKIAFAVHKRFWIVLSKHITRILELEADDRQVEDGLMMERIIVLIRNVLHIPMMSGTNFELDGEPNVQDRLIEHMNNSGILDILQYMISSDEHQEYCFHLIEIMYLMFREQSAEFLAKSVESDRMSGGDGCDDDNSPNHRRQSLASISTPSSRSQYERECDSREFGEARIRDQQEYLKIMEKCKAEDFTRFTGSSFVVKNMKSISERDMICHRAYLNPATAMDLNRDKVTQRKARNRLPMEQNASNSDALGSHRIHRSNRNLRSIMYDFCSKFLSDCYNDFMATIRSNLNRGNSQDNDQTYYLWAIQFFMEFSRSRENTATPEQKYRQIYETMATSTFHYLQTMVDDYLDRLQMKKEFKNEFADWSKRLHFALRSYRELLFSLASLERLRLPEASKMCHRIKTDIFTEPEYRELLLRLLQGYLEERMSKAYLRDLIETNHIFLKMLDYHSKISFNFKVKVKKRKQKRANKKKKNKDGENGGEEEEEVGETEPEVTKSPDDIWLDIIGDVSDTLASSQSTKVSEAIENDDEIRELFDPLTEKSLDDQKLDIMRKICLLLRRRQIVKAVALFREARNAMTGIDEDNVFGDADIGPEDELLALNEIMMAEFPEEDQSKTKKNKKVEEEEDDEEEEENEDEQFNEPMIQEKNFSLEDTIRRYAHPNVVRSYRLLLKNYRTNSPITNHSIVRMLHRIAVELKMIPLFYNLGYFVIFERILEEPSRQKSDPIQELAKFSHFVIRNFFKLLNKFPNIAAEILFVANSRDAYSMEYGFEQEQVAQMLKQRKAGAAGGSWTDEQKLELEVLYREYKPLATKEKDVFDLIQEHLIDDTKTRRQIIAQLKKMDILENTDIRKNSWKGPAWSDEEKSELEQLYHRFKDNLEEAIKEIEQDNITSSGPEMNVNLNLTTTIEQVLNEDEIADQNGEQQQQAEELAEQKDSEENVLEKEVVEQENEEEEEEDESNQLKKKIPKAKKQKIDIIECILRKLSSRDKRNRRQVIRQLKSMNIYDHSAAKKWSKEQIEALRETFCDIFVDFKEFERETTNYVANSNDDKDKGEEGEEPTKEKEIDSNDSENVSDNVEKVDDVTNNDKEKVDDEEQMESATTKIFNETKDLMKTFDFPKLLMERFGDKTKSYQQIMRQLKKMGFENNLQTMGVNNKKQNNSRGKNSKSSNDGKDNDDFSEESDDDDEDEDENEDDFDETRKSSLNKSKHRRNPFENEIVVQYDDDEDDSDGEDSNEEMDKNSTDDNKQNLDESGVSLIKQKKEQTKLKLEMLRNSMMSTGEDDEELDSDKSNDANEELPNKINKKKRRTFIEEEEEEDDGKMDDEDVDKQVEDESTQLRKKKNNKKKKRNIIKLIDSDSDSEDNDVQIVDSNINISINNSFSRRIVLSDSDDDEDNSEVVNGNQSKNMENDDDEKEIENDEDEPMNRINNKRKFDSDNELDDDDLNRTDAAKESVVDVAMNSQKKKRIVIEDDDEE